MPSAPASRSASVSARAAATIGSMPASRSNDDEPGSASRWTTPIMGLTTPKMPSMTLPAAWLTRQTVPGSADAWQATPDGRRRHPDRADPPSGRGRRRRHHGRRRARGAGRRRPGGGGAGERAGDAALRRAAPAARAARRPAPVRDDARGRAGGAARGPAGGDRGGDGGRTRGGRRPARRRAARPLHRARHDVRHPPRAVTAHRPPVAERAARVLRRAGVEPPGRVLAMVSGGADSTLLVAVLADLGLEVRALHVAHGLRGAESDADADFCRALPVPVEVVDGRVDPGPNLEARLRDVRRTAALAAASGDPVATGHTATDRAETVLYRLATSGGPQALPALPGSAPPFVRPLIDVTRDEVREELRRRGLDWREDPSNTDPAFARNRIRHEVLPVLTALNARADANIARAADVAAAERELLAALAAPF